MRSSGSYILRSFALREVRGELRQHHGRLLAIGLWIFFAILSAWLGLYLSFLPSTGGTIQFAIQYWNGQLIWWDFPILMVLSPWFQLTIPALSAFEIAFGGLLAAIGGGASLTLAISRPWRDQPKGMRANWLIVIFIGMLTVVTPLATSAATWYLAVLGGESGWLFYSFAWYVPIAGIITDGVLLLMMELWLDTLRSRGTKPGPDRVPRDRITGKPNSSRETAGLGGSTG